MDLQRYDTRDAAGAWMTRYWFPENTPLHDKDGRLVLILHASEEVTGE